MDLSPTTEKLIQLAKKATFSDAIRHAPTPSELGAALVDIRARVGFVESDEALGRAFLRSIETQPPALRQHVRFVLGLSETPTAPKPGTPTMGYNARNNVLHSGARADATRPRNDFLLAQVLLDLVVELSSETESGGHRGFWLQSVQVELDGGLMDPLRGRSPALLPLVRASSAHRRAMRLRWWLKQFDWRPSPFRGGDSLTVTMTLVCNQARASALSVPAPGNLSKFVHITASTSDWVISSRSGRPTVSTVAPGRPELVIPLAHSPEAGDVVTVVAGTDGQPPYALDDLVRWQATDMRESVVLSVTRHVRGWHEPHGTLRTTPVTGAASLTEAVPHEQEGTISRWTWSEHIEQSDPGATYVLETL